jgi:hypothetical protein
MGDRCVIGFKADKDATPIFLYSHWGGADQHRDVQRAIAAASCRAAADPAYATRIAISQIVGNNWGEETGFGISAGHNTFCQPDYEETMIIVWESQTIDIASSEDSTIVYQRYSFELFDTLLNTDNGRQGLLSSAALG